MNKLVCCASPQSFGCTFVDWSIHFLSGQNKFYSTKLDQWIDLSMNPLQTINAHGHRKNHPNGFDETKKTISTLLEKNGLVSYYPVPLRNPDVAKNLGIEMSSMTPDKWQLMIDYRDNDYNQLLKYSESCQAKIIILSLSESETVLPIYFASTRQSEQFLFTENSKKPTTLQDMYDEKDSVFFKDSLETWRNLGLTNKWDIRERMALSWPIEISPMDRIDYSVDHYWINAQSWWYDGKHEIKDIMAWLELDIDTDRFSQWIPVYEAWQQMQFKILKFIYNYRHITKCIVNNWSYPIDLTFEQEVIIQRCLIYQYGLNLKTWKLEKFPNNTKDLHQLLEPNIHPLI